VTETFAKVLIVEDEKQMKRYLATLLETSHFHVLECATAAEAIAMAAAHTPQLVLLDLSLPDGDGFDVIENLRQWTSLPIIVISARDEESAKVRALDLGADDYLTKPFGANELLARVRVALRHARLMHSESPDVPVFVEGPLTVDLSSRRAFVREEELDLTPTEYRLLAFLVQNAGRVVTHRQILNHVWGPNAVERPHYVRIYMANLRKKVEADPARPQLLMTETGVGYRLRCS
jgi:two-component system, OmpR family, KDP operon response regulator KdpE